MPSEAQSWFLRLCEKVFPASQETVDFESYSSIESSIQDIQHNSGSHHLGHPNDVQKLQVSDFHAGPLAVYRTTDTTGVPHTMYLSVLRVVSAHIGETTRRLHGHVMILLQALRKRALYGPDNKTV